MAAPTARRSGVSVSIGASMATIRWRTPPASATQQPSAPARPNATAAASGGEAKVGAGWVIRAPPASASTLTVAPGLVWAHVPGPSTHAVPMVG